MRLSNRSTSICKWASCKWTSTGVFALLALPLAIKADEGEPRVARVQVAADAVDPAVEAAQKQRVAAMQRAAEATVAIFGLDGGGGGSGVLITADGYALTNYHVSSACGDHMRCGLNDGRVYDAVIVGVDATGDVSFDQVIGARRFSSRTAGR